jgi:hypothetical protein
MAYIKTSKKETRQKYKKMSKNTCSSLLTVSKEGGGNEHEVPDNASDGRSQWPDVEATERCAAAIPMVPVIASSGNTPSPLQSYWPFIGDSINSPH